MHFSMHMPIWGRFRAGQEALPTADWMGQCFFFFFLPLPAACCCGEINFEINFAGLLVFAPAVAPSAAAELSLLSAGEIDAVVFSSTAEAQGLAMAAGGVEALLGMMARGNEARREKRKRGLADGSGNSDKGLGDLDDDDDIVLAAHGPYTAAGASAVLGVPVPVVPEDFSSFAGVVGALEEEFRRRRRRRRR